MRRLLLLGVCIVLASAMTANADGIFGTWTSGSESVQLDYARTVYSGTIDQIDVTISSINGAGSSKVNAVGSMITGEDAEFTALSGGAIVTDWSNYKVAFNPKTLVITPPAAPNSYVAYNNTAVAIDGEYSTLPGFTADAATFRATWFTSDTAVQLGVGGILAKIFVNTGGNFTLDSTSTAGQGLLGLTNGHSLAGSGSTIPEPGTLALLATGLMGLLAYAWRKRK